MAFAQHTGDPAFILLEKPISRGKKGLWQYCDDYKKTGKLYFTCPWCAAVQMIHRGAIVEEEEGTSLICSDGELYQSIWCRNSSCKRHLWIRFEGFKRKGPS